MHLFYIEHYLFNKQNGYADGIMDKDRPAMLPLAPLPFNLSDVRNAVPAPSRRRIREDSMQDRLAFF